MAKVSGTSGLVIATIVLVLILILGIVLSVIFYGEYRNITKNESPLCLTGSCAAPSEKCGYYPFQLQDGQVVCKSSIFNDKVPNVTTSSN